VRELMDVLKIAIKDLNTKRVVVDSVTTLYINKPAVARSIILQLRRFLAGMGCTAIFVSQISVEREDSAVPVLNTEWME